MRRKVLVITGANGFLARSVISQLDSDWQLVALIRPGTLPSSRFYAAHESVDTLVANVSHIDVVMHLAACIPSPLEAAHQALIPVNVNLVAELIQAFPNARHVLASSVAVFGVPDSLPLTMDSPLNASNAYALSKLSAENLVRKLPQHAVIRFSSLIGCGMKVGSFIPAVVSAARAGKICLRGSGERLQNYLDINDAGLMCIRAATISKSFMTLGIGEKSYSNNEVASILSGLTGAAIIREGNDFSPSYVYEFNNSVQLVQEYISLKESLGKMVRQA
jgi:UDP-glucose 4-epimerase